MANPDPSSWERESERKWGCFKPPCKTWKIWIQALYVQQQVGLWISLGSKYWINYYSSDAQMAWSFSLGCSQSSWGCCSSLHGVSFPVNVDWRIPSSLPFLSNLSCNSSTCLHLGITEKCLSDGDCSSPVSVSHRFTVPGCCFPFWILSSSHITRCLFEEFVLLFWDNVWKSLGFFMCGSSGWQFHDVSWQDSPFLTELTNLSLTMGWIEQCWLPEMLFSLGLMAQGC